jgi:hypothetical protein
MSASLKSLVAYQKLPPPRTLQQAYTSGPRVVLGFASLKSLVSARKPVLLFKLQYNGVQGYLTDKKTQPPRTLPLAYAWGPGGVLKGWVFSHGRGTPVRSSDLNVFNEGRIATEAELEIDDFFQAPSLSLHTQNLRVSVSLVDCSVIHYDTLVSHMYSHAPDYSEYQTGGKLASGALTPLPNLATEGIT